MRTTAWWIKVTAAAWVVAVFIVHYHVLLSKLSASLAQMRPSGP